MQDMSSSPTGILSSVRAGLTSWPSQITAEETDYGIKTAIHVPGKPLIYLNFHMPNINQVRIQVMIEGAREDAGSLWSDRLFWRVPVDDNHSVSYSSDWIPLQGQAAVEFQERRLQARATFSSMATTHKDLGEAVLEGKMELKDIDERTNMYQLFLAEDYAVQVGQGPVADRSSERLGRSDVGTFLLRKIWQRELHALDQGRPLKAWKSPSGLSDQSVIA